MWDKEYPVDKPSGVIRIALLGDSISMGGGIRPNETLCARLERGLNARAEAGVRYEVMNFAVAGYTAAMQLEQFTSRALAYDPDHVLVALTSLSITQDVRQFYTDRKSATVRIMEQLPGGLGRERPFARRSRELFEDAGVSKPPSRLKVFDEDRFAADRRLYLRTLLRRFLNVGGNDQGRITIIYLPAMRAAEDRSPVKGEIEASAAEAGVPFLDVSPPFRARHAMFQAVPGDPHPNSEAHRIFAEQLLGRLQFRPGGGAGGGRGREKKTVPKG